MTITEEKIRGGMLLTFEAPPDPYLHWDTYFCGKCKKHFKNWVELAEHYLDDKCKK